MKRIFIIDWMLIPSFLLSAYTGIELHLAGHGMCHDVWHNWAVFHVLVSFMFLAFVVLHVKMHVSWYKSILQKGLGNKSRITFSLSILFLILSLTGLVLLVKEGGNTCVGKWHYRVGLLMIVFSVLHIVKRWSVLRKSIKKH